MWILEEAFVQRLYTIPPRVAQTLDSLERPPRIFDIGGHVGVVSSYLLGRFPNASLTAIEANPHNARLHRRTIEANPGYDWKLIEAAATPRNGTMVLSGETYLSRVGPGEGESSYTVSAIDVLPLLEGADLVKLDIEGGEWEILADPRLANAGIRALVLEFHPYLAPSDDPAKDVRRLLEDAGFHTGPIYDFRHNLKTGNIWAWRPT